MTANLPTVRMPSGEEVCALGLGTWRMGEDPHRRDEEIAALRLGLDLGMTLIDTAEMYGEGGAEKVVARAIAGRRDQVFIVSKVYPHNAGRRAAVAACERSLKRLAVERIDLYLLHWRGDVPLEETVGAFTRLAADGKIRYWGVSNFDVEDMEELLRLPAGAACAANQVLYNLNRRGIEAALLPWCHRRGIALMAYSPVDQGRLLRSTSLHRLATARGATPAQLALAWLLARRQTMVIPKAADVAHVRENHAAAALRLGEQDLREIDAAFPPPKRRRPLEML